MSEKKQNNNSSSKAKNDKEITISLNLKHLILAIIIVVLSPVLVAIGITWPKFLFSHTSADANSWLQFWGSMLGGIIGTLAVIYVAHLQNAKQEEQLKIQNDKQEELLNRQLSQNEELNSKLITLEQNKIKREIYTSFLEKLVIFNKKLLAFSLEYEVYIEIIKKNRGDILDRKYYKEYLINDYKKLKDTEIILYDEYTYLQQWYETITPDLNNKIKNIDFPTIDFYISTDEDIKKLLKDYDIESLGKRYLEITNAVIKLEYETVYFLKSINSLGKFSI
ncbi:hypothetical protein ROU88_05540 [Macrococcus capreoli]